MNADFVFLNAEVITVNKENQVAEAVAIKGKQIVAVGTNKEIDPFISEKTEVIDLKGKSLLPGFIDSHLHLTMYGTDKLSVSCKELHIQSIEDIVTDLRKKARETPKGQWVRAWGFNEAVIREKRYPTKEELDGISIEHPIMITRADNHISVVNSKALEILGITKNTPDPEGGKIEHGQNGELTGRLLEAAHVIARNGAKFSEKEMEKAMSLAADDFIAAGITSIHDAGGYDEDNYRILQQAVRSGKVKVRVYAIVCTLNDPERFVRKMIDSGITTGVGDDHFRVGPAKIFTDGSGGGLTMATRRPYTSMPEEYGILYFSQEEINRILGEAHKKGFQITAHAIGDRAIEMVLNCIQQALEEHPREDHRHRIEHAGVSEPDLQERMKELGVIPIPNPPFFYEFGDIYAENYGERIHHMYPARDFIDKGIIAAAGSDCPVTYPDPLLGIHVAVNRKSKSGQVIGGKQRVEILEAIKLYTWNGAYASFEEKQKGSIETGKLADLVILDGSILKTEKPEIKDLSVTMTMIDGEVVYQKELAYSC